MSSCNEYQKHNFQPRYAEVPLLDVYVDTPKDITPVEIRSLLVRKVYIKDVCTWCGKEVRRNVKDSNE